jgi:hypothetical protein
MCRSGHRCHRYRCCCACYRPSRLRCDLLCHPLHELSQGVARPATARAPSGSGDSRRRSRALRLFSALRGRRLRWYDRGGRECLRFDDGCHGVRRLRHWGSNLRLCWRAGLRVCRRGGSNALFHLCDRRADGQSSFRLGGRRDRPIDCDRTSCFHLRSSDGRGGSLRKGVARDRSWPLRRGESSRLRLGQRTALGRARRKGKRHTSRQCRHPPLHGLHELFCCGIGL